MSSFLEISPPVPEKDIYKGFDTFLYQHFKRTGHSPDNVLVQPVGKIDL